MSETKKEPITTPDSFANELIRARTKMGLSVSELHRKTTISRTVIQGYESGKFKPGARELKLLCQALRITPNRLLFGTEAPFEEKTKLAQLVGDEQSSQQTIRLTMLFQMLSSDEKESFITLMQSILEGRVGVGKIEEMFAAISILGDEIEGKAENLGVALENMFSESDMEKMEKQLQKESAKKTRANKPKT